MTPISVLCIGYLLAACLLLLARVTSQLCLNETSGQWPEQGVVFQPGNIPAINRTLLFNGAFCANSII